MAARLSLRSSTDLVSPAALPQRKAAPEAVPHTQQRQHVLAHRGAGKRNRSCIRHAVAEAPPAQAPEALQLEVCFEAPPENYVPPTRVETSGRIISIGDIHGDINKAMRCLELARVAEFPNGIPIWTGGNTVVVQLGDILDRGDAEIATLMLLRQLGRQAEEQGGAVHILNGNHESLNVCGDFRYVTKGALLESAMIMGLPDEDIFNIDNLLRARLALFCPGQPVALELSKNPTVLIVNDTVFAHGSLLPAHVKHGIERINAEVAAWMRRDQLPSGGHAPPPFIAMGSVKGVMWNRTFGQEAVQPWQRVQLEWQLENVLKPLGCSRQVVGHTPQQKGANADCRGKVWRLDVGMSRNMLNAAPAVLEITDDAFGESHAQLLL